MFKNRSLTIGQLIQWTACGLFVSAIITAGFGILGYIFLTVTEDIGMIWLLLISPLLIILAILAEWVPFIVLYGFGTLVKCAELMCRKIAPEATDEEDSVAGGQAVNVAPAVSRATVTAPAANTQKQEQPAATAPAVQESEQSPADVISAEEKKELWDDSVRRCGTTFGKCKLCGQKHDLLYVEFEDFFGKSTGNICHDCFDKRNCVAVSRGPSVSQSTSYTCVCGERVYGKECPVCGRAKPKN